MSTAYKASRTVNEDRGSAQDPAGRTTARENPAGEDPARGDAPRAPGPWARWSPVVVLLALAVGVLVLTLDMPAGTPRTPGPGLWPLTVSIALLVVSALLVVTRNHTGQETWNRRALTIVGAVSSLAAFIVLFPLVGFTVPAMVMSLLWLKVFGRERWVTAVLTAVLAPVLLYLLFDGLLGVNLPRDLLMSTILGV